MVPGRWTEDIIGLMGTSRLETGWFFHVYHEIWGFPVFQFSRRDQSNEDIDDIDIEMLRCRRCNTY